MKTRKAIVDLALSLVGLNEKDGSFKTIIDIYNKNVDGYDLKYTDAWCAAFISALAVILGYTDIIPVECSCERMIEKAKKMGIWVEDDAYVPQIADIIMYDWQDKGIGDDTGRADHVGIVTSIKNGKMTVVEGNKAEKVDTRHISCNAKYIRGYITPKYTDETPVILADKGDKPTVNDKKPTPVKTNADNGKKTASEGYYVVVSCTALNVRSKAGKYSNGVQNKITKVLHRGDRCKIVSESNGWGKLETGEGYICLKYTTKA
jgi:CHAP domain./Bacterial SH3 domain.